MAAIDPPTTAILDHLHDWQRRAGVPLTWPLTRGEAYRQQWQIILAIAAA